MVSTVPGEWGSWSSWSECSTTCGQGLKQRSRLCDSPPPSGGGAQCQGDSLEVTPCSSSPCLVSTQSCHELINAYKTYALKNFGNTYAQTL